MYEHKSHRLLPRKRFAKRVLLHLAIAFVITTIVLLGGMAGYHYVAQLSWIDSFLNAAMILSGMGPMASLSTVSSKLFAGMYALFSGVVFIGVAGVMIAPFAHRILHHFHLEGPPPKHTAEF